MNRFFQALLDRFLRENLTGVQFRSEYGISHMFHYVPGGNPLGRRSPKPRPDFAVLGGMRVQTLLDAKYKDLWQYPVSRDMLYQLTLYALSNEQKRAIILYPSIALGARDQRIEFDDPVSRRNRAEVIVRPVNLSELEQIVSKGAAEKKRAEALAEAMVFG